MAIYLVLFGFFTFKTKALGYYCVKGHRFSIFSRMFKHQFIRFGISNVYYLPLLLWQNEE